MGGEQLAPFTFPAAAKRTSRADQTSTPLIQVADKRSPRGFLNMFRKLSLSIALTAVCTLGNLGLAQNVATSDSTSAGSSVELASYGRDYASTGYPQTPQAMAYGQAWGGAASSRDCERFYHYPYVFYPQNFRGSEYYRSSDSLYNRYPPEMQIPVYNRHWHNYYPAPRRYHWGHHFITDVF
jgi:hypothetical protein